MSIQKASEVEVALGLLRDANLGGVSHADEGAFNLLVEDFFVNSNMVESDDDNDDDTNEVHFCKMMVIQMRYARSLERIINQQVQ